LLDGKNDLNPGKEIGWLKIKKGCLGMMVDCRIGFRCKGQGYLIVDAVGEQSRTGEHVINRKGVFLRAVLTIRGKGEWRCGRE